MRTPALDSRTEPLHLPQIPSSPVRHRHPPRCPSPNPRAQHVLLPSRTSVPGKSYCLRLGNLVGICLPPSRTPPNSKPRSTSPQATPNSLQPGLAASTLTPYNPTSAHQLERPVENTHQMSLPCVKPFGDSSPHPLSWPRDPRASSSCLSPTLAISALPVAYQAPVTMAFFQLLSIPGYLLPQRPCTGCSLPGRPSPGASAGDGSSFTSPKTWFSCDCSTKPSPDRFSSYRPISYLFSNYR